MRPPKGYLATPATKRRSVNFNTTLSVVRSEIEKAAAELAKLGPDEGEIAYRIKGEVRIKRSVEKEALNVQVNWAIEAIEQGSKR